MTMTTILNGNSLKYFPLFLFLALSPAFAGNSKQVKAEGVLIEKQGSLFRLVDAQGNETLARVTDDTEIVEDHKNFLREPKIFRADDLRPGLSLIVRGVPGPDGAILASRVKFTNKARKLARVLDSTLMPTQSRLDKLSDRTDGLHGEMEDVKGSMRETRDAVNGLRQDTASARQVADQALDSAGKAHQRLDRTEGEVAGLGERLRLINDFFVVREEVVLFGPSSAKLTEEACALLDSLVEELSDPNSLVEVVGFASADGDQNYNRRLSQQRAEVVQRYLIEKHQVDLRRFVSPFGLGELQPVADNATRHGREKNRRAQIRILGSRGLSLPVKAAGSAGGS